MKPYAGILIVLLMLALVVGVVDATAPVSNFTSNVTSGIAPLNVQFTDTTPLDAPSYINLLKHNQANGCENGTHLRDFQNLLGGEARNASTEQAWEGTGSYKVAFSGAAAGQGFSTKQIITNITPSVNYTASVYVYSATGGEKIKIGITEYNTAAVPLKYYYPYNSTLVPGWQRIFISYLFTSNGAGADIFIATSEANATTLYFDGFQFEQSNATTPWKSANILQYPNDFDNAIWTPAYLSVSLKDATTAPDGTMTADRLNETWIDPPEIKGSNDHIITQHLRRSENIYKNETNYTFTVYLKPAERTWVELGMHGRDNVWRGNYFDINNCTVGSTSHDDTVRGYATQVANGFCRCSITFNSHSGYIDSESYPFILSALGDKNGQYAGDNKTGLYAWGAHLDETQYNPPTSSWLWQFGDGSTSTSQNPVYTYNLAGLFNVNMSATNTDGSDWENKTEYINVTGGNGIITGLTCTPFTSKVTCTWSASTSAYFNQTMIYRNGTFLYNVSNSTTTEIWHSQPTAVNMTMSTRTVDLWGNVNPTWVNASATTYSLYGATVDGIISGFRGTTI